MLPDADVGAAHARRLRDGVATFGLDQFSVGHVNLLPSVTHLRNHKVTPGDGTFGNVWRMTTDWQRLEGTWDRLRWARIRWQESKGISPNAEAAAESLGIKAGTYRAYERRPGSSKHIALDHQTAAPLAKKFGVSWIWLLNGEGRPDDVQLTPDERRVIDALREAPEARQTAVADAMIQLLKAS